MRRVVVALTLLAGVVLTAGFAALRFSRGRYGRPDYRVVDRRKGWELREYPPTIEARVVVDGDYEEAAREGFRVLAAYLFGANLTSDGDTEEGGGERIAMTAPVSVTEGPEGYTVAFTMPEGYALEQLPRPLDPRIELVEVPGRRLAARRFSGVPKRRSIDRESRRLQKALDRFGITPHESLIVAHYDPPMVPWFLRRNEVLVAVA